MNVINHLNQFNKDEGDLDRTQAALRQRWLTALDLDVVRCCVGSTNRISNAFACQRKSDWSSSERKVEITIICD
jgi:hypothetical protein